MTPAESPKRQATPASAPRSGLPTGVGLWGGFLDRLPSAEAAAAVRDLEQAGVGTVWLQEYSGVDPFVRAALYLTATQTLTVALGVATIHARDPEAMVAVASTLHEAFPGRFVLGLGASHRHLAETRGGAYSRPLTALRDYVGAMNAAVGGRTLPPLFLGALGPRMIELAATATGGLHTYFCPVTHTAGARAAVGDSPWIAPSQMVAVGGEDPRTSAKLRDYLGLCLGMPNYQQSLRRCGFDDADLATVSDALIDALVVQDTPTALRARVEAQYAAGANHVAVQFVPPPSPARVLERISAGLLTDGATAPGPPAVVPPDGTAPLDGTDRAAPAPSPPPETS
ncbi:TIGR03620 family F420-dependent LLM class oxidoreductase [Frankia sp. CNm7]|uniref:TIGR03620 family F420-dependent LLM class oxidoreductase n=1 Tax=Frankia nepalensis TaxID=1836974 RepID=A0A937RI21_9ACTN|nr:TIGR03620 family F420-dependent LLM class oxidoreductase [Frankia nepalensis]MBL7498983.1 TIGR03620 family F420-dependent LLM class oxidoreductase [Frankia nepalensis]MBL7511497.1 TIGR03620 family F420-dependent LLM class oxidoreductase [Frankia nepalensis]MBL7520713.1 TIGR03620 family F420-dependent LLM class oxidoreductase [Frankia nepalensis]MBL7630740.1 TIGR03620 family F420-dependent LLM class oxidoreductase [Frankia nepalensis]